MLWDAFNGHVLCFVSGGTSREPYVFALNATRVYRQYRQYRQST